MEWFLAAAMAIVGIASKAIEYNRTQEQLALQQKYNEEQRKIALEKINLQYEEAEKQAKKTADKADADAALSDKEMTVQEGYLSDEFNAGVDSLKNQQETDAYSWNYYAMNAGQQEGANRAAAGASGIRSGSTMDQALDMEAAVNSQQLQLNENTTRKNEENNLSLTRGGLASNMLGIQEQRINADWARSEAQELRDSYNAGTLDDNGNVATQGGYNWNLYQNNIKGVNTSADYTNKQINLQRSYVTGGNALLGYAAAGIQGGVSGYMTAYNLSNALTYYKNYKNDYSKLMV